MIVTEILSDIQAIENNAALFEETNFNSRANAIDFIEFHIIDRIDALLQQGDAIEELKSQKQRAEILKNKMEQIDINLFNQLREKIRTGEYAGASFREMINIYAKPNTGGNDQPGYDNLDVFINGLLTNADIPEPENELKTDMVFYQKTPARIIFELADLAQLTRKDVFFDIGSGLGQVPVLVNLLSGAAAKGVEFDPAYHNYAVACAARLNLPDVDFINADALNVNYTDGTVFFMYTPFQGNMLQEMLDLLKKESRRRIIRIYTYGPCSFHVAGQNWLRCTNGQGNDIYKLYEFVSVLSA